MSRMIERVQEVLLADGWHVVHDDSFRIESYAEVWTNYVQRDDDEWAGPPDGSRADIRTTGFVFEEDLNSGGLVGAGTTTVFGPLSSVLAVRASSRMPAAVQR